MPKPSEEISFYAEELFAWIKDEIKAKYQTQTPTFLVKNKFFNDEETIKWIHKRTYAECRKWVKYKHLQNNIFELKEYFPCPPNTVSLKMIDEVINYWEKHIANQKSLFFSIGRTIYSKSEARKIMLYFLRLGSSFICFDEPVFDPSKKRYVCKVSFQDDEYARIIPSGFMPLEQK